MHCPPGLGGAAWPFVFDRGRALLPHPAVVAMCRHWPKPEEACNELVVRDGHVELESGGGRSIRVRQHENSKAHECEVQPAPSHP